MCFYVPPASEVSLPLLKQTTSGFLPWFLWDSYGFMTTWTSPNHHGSWISPIDFHHPAPSAQAGWRSVKALAGRRVRWMMVTCWETSTAKRIMMTINIVLLVLNVHIVSYSIVGYKSHHIMCWVQFHPKNMAGVMENHLPSKELGWFFMIFPPKNWGCLFWNPSEYILQVLKSRTESLAGGSKDTSGKRLWMSPGILF